MSPKKQLQSSLSKIDSHITSTLHSRLSVIHDNDKNLSKQTKSLQSCTHDARKQEEHWDHVVRIGRNGLKDLGDAGNWAMLLDREITFLERVMQQVQQ